MTAFRPSTSPGVPALTPATTAYKIAAPPPSSDRSATDRSTDAPQPVHSPEPVATDDNRATESPKVGVHQP